MYDLNKLTKENLIENILNAIDYINNNNLYEENYQYVFDYDLDDERLELDSISDEKAINDLINILTKNKNETYADSYISTMKDTEMAKLLTNIVNENIKKNKVD